MGTTLSKSSTDTAISRTTPSKPLQILSEKGLLKGRMLDYGCGRGYDAEFYGMDAYDPHYKPTPPTGKFDTITCTYVLNTLHLKAVEEVLSKIKNLLKKSGAAYIAVRRDIVEGGYTSSGTFQRNVKLNLPVIHEDCRRCIYKMKG